MRTNDNRVVSATPSVTFSKLSGTGGVTTLPKTVSAANGIASVGVKGVTAGPITVQAQAAGLTPGTTTFTVVP